VGLAPFCKPDPSPLLSFQIFNSFDNAREVPVDLAPQFRQTAIPLVLPGTEDDWYSVLDKDNLLVAMIVEAFLSENEDFVRDFG
jgi:hypothetical protein